MVAFSEWGKSLAIEGERGVSEVPTLISSNDDVVTCRDISIS